MKASTRSGIEPRVVVISSWPLGGGAEQGAAGVIQSGRSKNTARRSGSTPARGRGGEDSLDLLVAEQARALSPERERASIARSSGILAVERLACQEAEAVGMEQRPVGGFSRMKAGEVRPALFSRRPRRWRERRRSGKEEASRLALDQLLAGRSPARTCLRARLGRRVVASRRSSRSAAWNMWVK